MKDATLNINSPMICLSMNMARHFSFKVSSFLKSSNKMVISVILLSRSVEILSN